MRYLGNYANSDKIVQKLGNKIIKALTTTLVEYSFLYSVEELKLLVSYKELLEKEMSIDNINIVEENAKKLVFRTWIYESEKGNNFIHWLKNDTFNKDKKIISSTFGDESYNFCDSSIGIKYSVNLDSFIAACEKDAACIREDDSKKSIYTIFELENGNIVNSYNLATPIITPKDLFSYTNNEYLSKHNEIILNSRYAKPIEIICLNDTSYDIARNISEENNIPFNDNKIKTT